MLLTHSLLRYLKCCELTKADLRSIMYYILQKALDKDWYIAADEKMSERIW